MKVGFIGLGIMGKPMALNLLRAGYSMAVYNRTREKCKFLEEAGAEVKDTPAEVAMVSDVVIVIVTDTPDVESVLFGPDGVSEGLSPGKVLIDMSTISPDKTVDFATQLQEVGVEMLDAPVSGGERGAKEGSLTVMVGGNEEVYESCLPIFQAMGKNIAHVGRNGDGQRVKLVNQVICGLNILAVVEGMRLARESGLDTKIVHQVVSTGAAGSWMLSNLGRAILSEDYSPGFKIALQSKDLRLAIESMHALKMDAPGTELTYSLFKRASESGLGELGTQGLLKLFEDEDGQ